MAEAEKIIFQPVRGTQAAINRQPIQEGYVYYAYDSGRIYLDKNGNRYLMSNKAGGGGGAGGTGIIYANGTNTQIIPEDLTEREPTVFIMALEALEDQQLPEVDNLILNSDGRFFRVIAVDEYTSKITVKLLAVSGSGSGGGGGGSSTVERDVDITWDANTIATGHIYIYGQSYNAVFTPSTTASGDINCNVTFTIIDNEHGTSEKIVKNNQRSDRPFNLDMSILPESSDITLQILVTSDNSQYNYGMGYQRNITGLRVVRMELEKPVSNTYIPLVQASDLSGNLTLKYRPIGDSSLNLTLHTYIDNVELGRGTTIPTDYLGQVVSATIPRQAHGVHQIKFQLTTVIGGETVASNSITYEGAWAGQGETSPIIWVGSYDKTIIQYENSYIYYMVFDPVNYANGIPAEIHLYKDGYEVSQIDGQYSDNNWLVWDISNLYTVDEDQTITRNEFSITCGGERVIIPINVTTEGSRALGLVEQTSLILNMTTAGRSSSEIKRNRSIFKSTANTDNITTNLIDFNWQNNGWKNTDGIDKNGVDSGSYLSIANGSSMTTTIAGNGLILNGQKNYTFELRFRIKNVQEYSTLVTTIPKYYYEIPDENNPGEWIPQYSLLIEDGDTKIISSANPRSYYEWEIEEKGYRIGVDQYGNLLMDEEKSIKEVETEKGVVVKWLNTDNYGFVIGTQEAFFKTPSGVANVRYCEDEVINISMVVSKDDHLCYVYLNGILAGAADLPTDTGSSFTINTPFEFNSKYCDFDLYRFRIYELGLTMPQVIHNYLSDMHSIKLYDQNQLTNPLDPTALSYPLLVQYNQNHPEEPTMPYAVWQITDGTDELLSYKKGNNRAATVEFVNPSLDIALANGDITPWKYYCSCPSFYAEKVDLNVQGTSSQKYPRRNYKLKYKSSKDTWVYTQGPLAGYPLTADYYFYKSNGELVTVEKTNEETNEIEIVPIDKADYNSATMNKLGKKYHMDTESFGTNKFTWKIDYMESSGSYNTGFANLMGNLVHPLYTKHPLDDYNLGINTSDMRTTVYGFPVLTFHKYSNGQYEYIGRYNMNLDKSSNEYYGFEEQVVQPYVPARTKKVLNKTTNEYEDKEYQPTIAEIAECWELKDNQGNWCSFKYPNAASRRTGFMTLQEGTSGDGAKLEILNHYEYRYSYYGDQLDAAYEYTGFTDPDTQVTYSNNGQINTYLYEKHKNLERLFNWLDSTDPDVATNANLTPAVVYNVASTDLTDTSISYEVILNDAAVIKTHTKISLDDTYDENLTYFYLQDENNEVFVPYTYNENTWLEDVGNNKIYTYTVYDESEDYYIKKNDNYWFYTFVSTEQFNADITNGVIFSGKFSGSYKATFSKDTKEYRRQKFRAELSEHLDKEYCLTYYVLTELLLCYDSRGKNCMMATFGPQRAGGDYIWYPIFYDIDTQLGLNNSGAYLWDYDADVTENNLFSTPTSILWNNLYDLFYDDIVQKYRVLRGISNPSNADAKINGSLTYENIAGAYECNPVVFNSYAMMGVRPIVAIGLDEYYKFLAPALTEADFNEGKLYAGYYDTKGTHAYQQTPDYIYACQGDKKLTTELLLRNRLNYIDSWWMGGDYRAGVVENEIFVRANANHRETSDLFLDSNTLSELPAAANGAPYKLEPFDEEAVTSVYDGKPGVKIKPFLHQYISYFHDSQPSKPKKYSGGPGEENGLWTNVDSAKEMPFRITPDLSQQIYYIPGGDYISSLGDISLMYPNSLQIFHGQRMLDFRLGSDVPGYKNPLITSSSDWSLSTMPLLKQVNISNLGGFNRVLYLQGSAKLQEFRALGSIIERVNFASGAPLHTVHLPATMTTISFVQNQNLNKLLTVRPKAAKWVNKATGQEVEVNNVSDISDWSTVELVRTDPEEYRGLYIENVTDYNSSMENNGHNINTYEVVSGGLGYNSYIILNNLYQLKHNATRKQELSIGLTDVQWTPYIVVENGTPYESTETYYFLNDHSSFEAYHYVDQDGWEADLKNSLVYTYNTEYTHNEEATITDLSLLDNLIAQYEDAKERGSTSQFSNLTPSTNATMPTITGNLYVSNTTANKIKETDLTEIYKQYFPYLSISAKYVQESNVTKYVRIFADTGIIETIETLRSDNEHPLPPSNLNSIPTRAGYDFIGWSTDPEGNHMLLRYQKDYNTGFGSYVDIETSMNSFTFTDSVSVLTLYAQYQEQRNVMVIYQDNTRIGAATIVNGSAFKNPTTIYKYVDNLIDSSVEYSYLPYKDDSSLPLKQTYRFIGYSTTSDCAYTINDQNQAIITNPPPENVDRDLTLYEVFMEDSVYNDILPGSYLTCVDSGIGAAGDKQLRFNTDGLKGKITLPATWKDPNTGIVYTPVEFKSEIINYDITHIFFEPGSMINTFADDAFYVDRNYASNMKLKYVEIPNANSTVRARSFQNCISLFDDSKITENELVEFFSNISTIYSTAFTAITPKNNTFATYATSGGFKDRTIYLLNSPFVGSQAFSTNFIKEVKIGGINNPADINQFYYPNRRTECAFYNCETMNANNTRQPVDITVYVDSSQVEDTNVLASWVWCLCGIDINNSSAAHRVHLVDAYRAEGN